MATTKFTKIEVTLLMMLPVVLFFIGFDVRSMEITNTETDFERMLQPEIENELLLSVEELVINTITENNDEHGFNTAI